MKFPFLRCPTKANPAFPLHKYELRPVITIRVINTDDSTKFCRVDALLDTGADLCVFHSDLAPLVGIKDYKKGVKMDFSGVGGGAEGFVHEVILEVGGWEIKSRVAFTDYAGKKNVQYGLLGKKGFLEHFKVTFDYKKEAIDIKRSAPSKRRL